jgi:hypothetical protein
MIEKPHSIEVAQCPAVPFNKIETDPVSAVVELVGQRQDAHGRIDHQLASCWKPDEHVGFAVRMT